MRSKTEIKDRIKELEDILVPEELEEDEEDAYLDDGYLDEGQQSELSTLYWVLGEDA